MGSQVNPMEGTYLDPSLYQDSKPPVAAMDAQMAPVATPSLSETNAPAQSDVDELLRKKRKVREHKACYPCRQRKVKCDTMTRPCQTCRDRDHPELCSYHPSAKRPRTEQSGLVSTQENFSQPGSAYVTLGRSEFDMICRKLEGLESSLDDLRRELRRNSRGSDARLTHDSAPTFNGAGCESGYPEMRHTSMHGIHTTNDAGGIVHLGGSSIPAMLLALGQGKSADQPGIQELLGKSVLPMFGLDNESATYPFVDLWGLAHGSLARAQELAKALPVDSQMLTLFGYYRDMGHVIFPGVADMPQLEYSLTTFLNERAARESSDEGVTEHSIYGQDYHWLGLIFAVLASGAQCSGLQRRERELTSMVYMCCSAECLRRTNFLSQGTLQSLQTLLVIQNVLSNNMNAGTAWTIMGLTIRLAQGLGLHQACPPSTSSDAVFIRSKIWWALVWQDSLLSITYDRASSTLNLDANSMPMPQYCQPIPHYHASMYRLAKVCLDIVQDRAHGMSPRARFDRIVDHRDTMSAIMNDAAEYLRDTKKCTTRQETLEHWGLYMHISYALTELCRPAISPSPVDHKLAKTFKPVCIDNLMNTVEAFLGLNNITPYTRQSWASVHRGLGSALLLGILGEHKRSDRARGLLCRFIAVMHDITTNIDPQEISAPVQRGVVALRKLNIQEDYGTGAAATYVRSPVDDRGPLTMDISSIFSPSNSETTASTCEDYSPYDRLNAILWGRNHGYLDTAAFVAP